MLTLLSLLKTVNHRECLEIFLRDRGTVGRNDRHSIRSRFLTLVPVSQPSFARARACCPATSADRLAAATPSPTPVPFRRPTPLVVALPSAAADPRNLGRIVKKLKLWEGQAVIAFRRSLSADHPLRF